jgi:hypothetical protein
MRIFLSYASVDRDAAEQIYLILMGAKHKVFFDRSALQGGENFNSCIQRYIKKSDLLVFLISPDSVAKSSYTLTELKLARQKWPHPEGHLLPVMIRQTNYDLIPQYLKAVSILEPEGNLGADVSQQLVGWERAHGRNTNHFSTIVRSVLVLISFLGVLTWYYWKHVPVSVDSPSAYSSPGNAYSTGLPSSTGKTENAGGTSIAPLISKNAREAQSRGPARMTLVRNGKVEAAAAPESVPFVLSSRVFDGENPVKGAAIRIVEAPELGLVETDSNGAFVFKGVRKKIGETLKIRIEHQGFNSQDVEVTIGKHLPLIYLERVK